MTVVVKEASPTCFQCILAQPQPLEVSVKQDASLDAVGETQRALTVLLLDVAQNLDQLQHTDQNITLASPTKHSLWNPL